MSDLYKSGSELSKYADESTWMIGDIVTRDGTDEHEIIFIEHDAMRVLCIKVPSSLWCRLGETEWNNMSRYHFVRRPPPDPYD